MSGSTTHDSNAVAREICANGIVQVGINLGNPVIAIRHANGALQGIELPCWIHAVRDAVLGNRLAANSENNSAPKSLS
ncbi:MAG: hypothetical protein ABIS17_01425 [Casimicrobiaceae bacterium]